MARVEIVYLPGSMRAAGKLKRPRSSVTPGGGLGEPSFLALTSTPSIAPSSLEDCTPVEAACAWAPLDINAAASRATAAPSQRCRPRMGDLPMNRSSMSGLSRDFISGESVAATSAEGVKRHAPWPHEKWPHEKMTARAAGAMVRRASVADHQSPSFFQRLPKAEHEHKTKQNNKIPLVYRYPD